MKKRLMALVVLMVVMTGTSLFGQGLGFSAGAGLVVAPEWGKIEFTAFGERNSFVDNFQMPIGVQAFFDATFAQVRIGYLFGGNRNLKAANNTLDLSGKYDFSVLDFTILGKYPFQIGPITLSPVAGIGYTMFTKLNSPADPNFPGGPSVSIFKEVEELTASDEDQGNGLATFFQSSNRWWINAGIDAEIPLTGNIFLQPSVLAQFGLASYVERSQKEFLLQSGVDSYSQSNFRLQTSLSVGYRF